MGANLSPMIEILQNQNVQEFSYTITGNPHLMNEEGTPLNHMRMIQKTLGKNSGLKSLYLNFSEAFEDDNGDGLFDDNENAFLTSHFLTLLQTICSMFWLEKIVIKLPLLLADIMDGDIKQYQELEMLFDNIKISTQQTEIFFAIENEKQNQELKRRTLITTEKRIKIEQSLNKTEPTNSIIKFDELHKYPHLDSISKNYGLLECLYLDLNLYYYVAQHISTFLQYGDDKHSIPIKNLLDAISFQFFHKIQFLQKTSENELVTYPHLQHIPCNFEIFQYLNIKDLHSLILTVGGLHRSIKVQFMKLGNTPSYKSLTFFPHTEANISIGTRLMQTDCTINVEHLYTSEDINVILRVRFKDRNDVHIMAPLQFSQTDFKELFMNAIINNPEGRLLLPINTGLHWVGICLTRTNEGYEMNFYDSLISEERLNTIKNEVLSYFDEDTPVVFKAMNAPYLQPDCTSCGAYLIENMFRDLHHLPVDEEISPERIRGLHLELLSDNEPNYYMTQIPISHKRKRRDGNDNIEEFDEILNDNFIEGKKIHSADELDFDLNIFNP